MNHFSRLILASCLVFFGLMLPAEARADARIKKTIITTNGPVKVPSANLVLPRGKYVLKLVDVVGTKTIVQILNEREDKVLATVLAIPNYRIQPVGDSLFTFWETPAGEPVALRSWFYPGSNYGIEFVYPRNAAVEVARRSERNVPTVYTDSDKASDLTEARIGATTPEGAEAELAKETYTAPKPKEEDNK